MDKINRTFTMNLKMTDFNCILMVFQLDILKDF